MVPLKYNVRNLRVRWVNTLMTVLGTGMIVWSSCSLFSLVEGLQHSLKLSGDPLDLIVLRKGSTLGDQQRDRGGQVRQDPQPGRDRPRRVGPGPGCWGAATHPGRRARQRRPGEPDRPGSRAGLAAKLRPDFQIVQGRDLEAGKGEAIVSKSMSRRFKGAGLGETLQLGAKESYRVVGLFTAGGSAAESEAWVDLKRPPAEHEARGIRLVGPGPGLKHRRPRPAHEDDRATTLSSSSPRSPSPSSTPSSRARRSSTRRPASSSPSS